jgi:hypothetical protein
MTKLEAQWIVGFVDGEGCFSIDIIKNTDLKLNYQVQLCLTVVQHSRNIHVLYAIKDYFGIGSVTENRRETLPSGVESVRWMWRTKNISHIKEIIIPFFEKHTLKTKKNVEFQKFKKVCNMMEKKLHLTEEGLEQIRKIQLELRKDLEEDMIIVP